MLLPDAPCKYKVILSGDILSYDETSMRTEILESLCISIAYWPRI